MSPSTIMIAEGASAPEPLPQSMLAPALAGGDFMAYWETAMASHLLPRSVLVPWEEQPPDYGRAGHEEEPERVGRRAEPAVPTQGQRLSAVLDAGASPRPDHSQPPQWMLHLQALAKQQREQHKELLAKLELLEARQCQQHSELKQDVRVVPQAMADLHAQLRLEVVGMLMQREERLVARMGRCLSECRSSSEIGKDPVGTTACRPHAQSGFSAAESRASSKASVQDQAGPKEFGPRASSTPTAGRTRSGASTAVSHLVRVASKTSARRHTASCDLPLGAGVLQQVPSDGPKLLGMRRLLFTSLTIILANMVLLGLELDVSIDAARNHLERPRWVFWLNMLFATYYTVELALRFALEREAFCGNENRGWNIFDALLVLAGWADTIFIDMLDLNALRILRVHLVLRSFRILRFLGSFRRLRLVVSACTSSLSTALWAFVFAAVVLYMFAVLILQGVEQHARAPSEPSDSLYEHYGSIGRTTACLFMAITGGREWGALVEPLGEVSVFYTGLFVLYVAFAFVFVANVLTAVFVERSSQLAKADSDLALLEEYDQNRQVAARITDCLKGAKDEEVQSPIIGKRELEWLLQDTDVMEPIRTLGLDATQVIALFDLMANDELGGVDREELAHALTRLKSSANCGGIATLMFENQRMNKQLCALIRYLEHEFAQLGTELDKTRTVSKDTLYGG